MSTLLPIGLDSTSGEEKIWKTGDTILGASPASPDTSVQFNDGGSFGGSSALIWGGNYLKLGSQADNITGQLFIANKGNDIATFGVDNDESVPSGTSGTSLGFNSGDAFDTGGGGYLQFTAGRGGATSGSGGSISLTAGSAQGGDSDGGGVTVQGGNSSGINLAGQVAFNGGDGDGGNAGGATVQAFGGTVSQAGDLSLAGGQTDGGDTNGGNVLILGGQKSGAGTNGKIKLQTDGTPYAILDTSLLSSSDKTFTFNNSTGGFVIADGNTTASAPSTTATPIFTSYYGGNTKALGDPNAWISINIAGTTYKVPLYT